MALLGNGIISQNKLPIFTAFPFRRFANKPHHHYHSKPNFHLNPPFPTLSCLAKTSLSEVQEATTTKTTWLQFSGNVSGEWDGFGADFTAEGKPIELPESVVPSAYREWEVQVFDWQTQCPTLAQPDELTMTYKNIKLLPTVGCEADAATRYSVDERIVGGVDSKVSAFAYHSTGSYVAIWLIGDHESCLQLELEFCFINPKDRESRVRIIQVVHLADSKMMLESIRVFCEQWYGPFRNGDQLGGCAIRDSAFASTAALKASEIVGLWQGPTMVAHFDSSQTDFLQELLDESLQNLVREECDVILLPKHLWCSLKESKDGITSCEAGWLFDHGHALTSRCIFSRDAELKMISLARETATLESCLG